MINGLKTAAIVLYLLAALGTQVPLPLGMTPWVHLVVAILLGAHVLEALVALQYVKRYPGQLVDSIALTLLFGFLHWLPLKQVDQQEK